MSLKTKIILAIAASVTLSALLVLVPLLFGMNSLIEQGTKRELEQVRLRFETALEDRFHSSLSMASMVARMPEVQRAVATSDRQMLNDTFVPGFAALRDDQGVRQFHFHTPASHSFFRVNKPETFGDDLSGFRHTVVQANATKAAVIGLELGRGGLGVRGIAPIAHDGAHVGTVEIGLSLDDAFFQSLVADSPAEMEFYVLPKGDISNFATSDSDAFNRTVASIELDPLLTAQDVRAARETGIEAHEIAVGDEKFGASAFPVRDFSGDTVGLLHVMVPRSSYLAVVNEVRMIALGATGAALIIGLLGAMLFGGRITKTLAGLIDKLGRLDQGDLDIDVSAEQTAGGELGRLADGIAAFRDHRLHEVETLSRERATAQAHRTALVEVLGAGLHRLSEGDLSTPITQDLGEGYNSVRDDYNASLDSLARLIGSLTEAAT
ncbi:MAG: cache domain-containing protein [Rhodovulum sp.]